MHDQNQPGPVASSGISKALPALLIALCLLLAACGSPEYRPAPELQGISSWINSEPLTLEGLRGRVVLLDFWTYSCVNCIRTLPFLRDWHRKYADRGLVIVGVHTPEFQFEKLRENVAAAARNYQLEYPIAQDNDYATWHAYANQSWPAKYLIDGDGLLRYFHFGEEAYLETERTIRDLLAEAGADLSGIETGGPVTAPPDRGAPAPPPEGGLTRELYAGYQRNPAFPEGEDAGLMPFDPGYIMNREYYQQQDADSFYQDPGHHRNQFIYLHGAWRNGPESVSHSRTTQEHEDYIAIRFYASSVNAVLGRGDPPGLGATPAPPTLARVTLDGQPLSPTRAGADVRWDEGGHSYIPVDRSRMYRVVRLPGPSSHELKLSPNSPDFSLFTFTFGAYPDTP